MGKNEREFLIDQVIKIVACDGMPKRHVAMLNEQVIGQVESIQHEIDEVVVEKIQSQSMPMLEAYTHGAYTREARYARYARVAKQAVAAGLSNETTDGLLRLFFENNVAPSINPEGLRVTVHAADPKNEVAQRVAARVNRVARAVEDGAHEISLERLHDAKDYAEREEARASVRPTVTESRLAWSVFCSDPEVLAFVRVVGEVPPAEPAYDYASVAQQREDRALRIAWARNEKGWAHRARLRAHQMLRTLPGVETNREPGK
jgi:hypothetical protein